MCKQLQLHDKVKPFFRVEIGACDKSADIGKKIKKFFFFCDLPKAN